MKILWNYTYIISPSAGRVKITLWRAGGTRRICRIAQDISITQGGSGYSWTVPSSCENPDTGASEDLTTGDLKIRVRWQGHTPAVYGESSYFEVKHSGVIIRGDTIKVLSPNGGERWKPGTYRNIRWRSSLRSGSVRIILLKKLLIGKIVKVGIIAENIPISLGSYRWKVGNYLDGVVKGEALKKYFVRIEYMDDPGIYDESDGPFAIFRIGTAEWGTFPSEAKGSKEATISANEMLSIFGDVKIYLDRKGSWIQLILIPSGETVNLDLDIGEFTKKGPAGVRKIKHKLQDITCLKYQFDIVDGKVNLKIRCETGGPIEVKRYGRMCKSCKWRDKLAFDINLHRFEYTVTFEIGDPNLSSLTERTIIKNVGLSIDSLEMDVSNIPDAFEILGIFHVYIKDKLKSELRKAFQSSQFTSSFYNMFINWLKSKLGAREIVNVYTTGHEVKVLYQ